ncbi:MAG: phosphoribosylformylglycinamidine cyclo-ligase [Helicobacteraceae bacterium]|nr:phosphoribosylformylglycinamidine cyclo-ligase [Helicobacteraceae bacterium]
MEKKISYKDSGVDIDEGNVLVSGLKNLVKSTFNENVIGGIGSFAGAYALPSGFKNPVILGATDGVGTKLRIAIDSNRLDSIGIDLVAMCVNDLICNFATPLFFLDYYATAKLDSKSALEVISGIVRGCKEASCALIGGESAEMPGMYHKNDFDLAGFAVGIAEKEDLIEKSKVKKGDILIALSSSGIHSNGYSLVRKICFEKLKLDFSYKLGEQELIDILLEPTKIYVKTFLQCKDKINALAHITGGGIVENLPRVFSKNLGAKIDKNAIRSQEIFNLLSKYVENDEMYRTFNMGVGMILVVDKNNADNVVQNSGGYVIGEVDESGSVGII